MNTRKLTISSKNISQKQWTNLLIELNLVKEAWRPYARLELQAPGLKKILAFGRRTNDTKEDWMDLIIWSGEMYQLIPVTKQIMDGIVLTADVDCFDLCEILRLKLTGYVIELNLHIMNDDSGNWIGCMCK